jgi:hypothetical protein
LTKRLEEIRRRLEPFIGSTAAKDELKEIAVQCSKRFDVRCISAER